MAIERANLFPRSHHRRFWSRAEQPSFWSPGGSRLPCLGERERARAQEPQGGDTLSCHYFFCVLSWPNSNPCPPFLHLLPWALAVSQTWDLFLVASKDGSFYCASYRLAPCLPCQFAFVVVGVLYMTPDQQLSTKILQDQGMCQTPAWKHWGGSNSVWVVESIDPHPHHVLQSECVCAHTMIFEYVKVV